jgi:tripartite-type tricarboxylate transporter receptor subunit TctC
MKLSSALKDGDRLQSRPRGLIWSEKSRDTMLSAAAAATFQNGDEGRVCMVCRANSLSFATLPIAFVWAATIIVGQAHAQSPADFYHGKQITIVVGSDAGGGYDAYARLIANYMSKYVPGNPTFIVQNMPGAGSLIATNYVANVAPKDGTMIAAIHADTVIAPLLYPDQAKFDARRLNWIGAPVTITTTVAVWHTAPVQTFDQIFNKELIVAASGGDSITLPLLTNALLGTKFKIVQGYKSAMEGLLAIRRGEAQGVAGNALSFMQQVDPTDLESKDLRIIASFGLRPDPQLAGIPSVMDYAKTKEQKEALSLILSEQDFGWPYLMAAEVPADRVKAIRDAFDATMKDPGFLADAKKGRLDVRPTSGVDQAKVIAKTYDTPKEIVEQVAKITGH